VRYLRSISILIFLAGIALTALSVALDLSAMWTVAGMLLVVAGLVKIGMVYVWQTIAGFGSTPPPGDDT